VHISVGPTFVYPQARVGNYLFLLKPRCGVRGKCDGVVLTWYARMNWCAGVNSDCSLNDWWC